MAKLDIITVPDPLLRTASTPVERVDDALRRLIDDMFETMYDAPGIGLAAIQVAVPKRLLIADVAREYRAYYKRVDDASASTYLMDHSSFIYVMSPAGEFVTSFTHQTPPEEMFSELEKMVRG